MNDIMNNEVKSLVDKKVIRKELRQKRDALHLEEVDVLSKQITMHLIESSMYKECSHICVYEAFRNEVSCKYIKEQAFQDGKCVFIPVTDEVSKTMEFYQIIENTVYQEGNYGIYEPVIDSNSKTLQDKALILMPGLGFDKNKHRLGYGGGYYDKYLAIHPEHVTVALCYHFQIVEALPYEAHDVLPDYIVTEDKILI